jgi:PAS domain S-box-containing protein
MKRPSGVLDTAVRVLFVNVDAGVPVTVSGQLDDSITTYTVGSRESAVDTVVAEPVDCVVVEHTEPGVDAVALTEAVRKHDETVPVVLFTAVGSEALAMEATRAGVTEYVPMADDTAYLAERIGALTTREDRQNGTERELARLERKSEHLESLVESAPLAIVEFDREGTVVRWNRGAEETFGWTSEEVLGEFNPIAPESELPAFERMMDRLLGGGQEIRGVEAVGQTKKGDRVDLLLSAAPITDAEGEPRSVTAVLSDITEQKRMEQCLRQLQETAQELSVSPSIAEIGEIATGAAAEVLGLELTGLWRYDERENALVPLSVTREGADLIPDPPKFTPGSSLAWEVFETGEAQFYDELRDVEGRYNPESAIRSEILVPLGEYGVLITGSPSPQQFSETDLDLFRILGATVEAAMVRANREEELRLQNERLDEFADVVAHDLRNPLSVAKGFLDMAEETGDPEQFETVRSALDRIGQLIDDLLTLAQGEATVENREPIDLGDAAEGAWELVDTDGASLSVDDPPRVSGDPSRVRQLLENLFRNSVEHGGTGEATVTVTVGAIGDGHGFYVEDDGVGIPTDRQGSVLNHGVTFSDEGTGFGLSIVADIARAHGWSVTVTDADSGGARFEFRAEG